MRTPTVIASLTLATAAVILTACSKPAPAGNAAPPAPAAAGVVKQQTLCPVQGGPINKDLFVDQDGKRIYVCCQGCIDQVKNDFAKYAKKLEDTGVVLETVPVAPKTE